jgi:hydroxyethylthiazole kinase-like uncharacterized protein yjeF
LLIVGGNRGMTGAGVIAALAAFKSGCGYVYLCSDNPAAAVAALPEVVTAVPKVVHAQVIGPGLGRTKRAEKKVRDFLKCARPTVIDGDALYFLAKKRAQKRNAQWVLTPHTLEMARLLGVSSKEVDRDREAAVRACSRKFCAVSVLKGPGTLVCDADGERVFRNPTGSEAMATAGQGDCLSGVIGALLSDGVPCFEAALLAVFIHGLAGDTVAASAPPPIPARSTLRRARVRQGVLAHEVATILPTIISSLAAL